MASSILKEDAMPSALVLLMNKNLKFMTPSDMELLLRTFNILRMMLELLTTTTCQKLKTQDAAILWSTLIMLDYHQLEVIQRILYF